jgi:hypothetical protein
MERPSDREMPRIVRGGQEIDLGDIDSQVPDRQPVTAVFRLGGERFRVNPDLSEVDAIDFMDEAEHVDPQNPAAITLVKRWAKSTVHPGDFDAFWKKVRAKGLDSTGIMSLMWIILDGITDLPTGPPSSSFDGRQNTSTNSPAGSSAPVADPSTPDVYSPTDLYGPAAATPVADGAEAFLRLIDKYQARGDGYGVVMAAQIATMAEARGIDVSRGQSASRTA